MIASALTDENRFRYDLNSLSWHYLGYGKNEAALAEAAEEWGIDPQKIGVLGFSAGAELAAAASLEYTAFDAAHAGSDDLLAGITSRPDFLGLIYPGASPCIRNPRVAFELQTDGACCLSLRFRSNAV